MRRVFSHLPSGPSERRIVEARGRSEPVEVMVMRAGSPGAFSRRPDTGP
jgi:hypothetical protein